MLAGMAVRPSGPTGQRGRCSIPAGLPEVDIRPAFVVLPAGTAHAVFLCAFHQGSPVRHVLCYTLAYEGFAPLVKLLSATPTFTDEALFFILFYSTVQYVLYFYIFYAQISVNNLQMGRPLCIIQCE